MVDSLLSKQEFHALSCKNIRLNEHSYKEKNVKIEEQSDYKVIDHTSYLAIDSLEGEFDEIITQDKLNNVRYLNKFLASVNSKLKQGGNLIGRFEEYNSRKSRLLNKRIKTLNYLIHGGDIIFNRVFPKLAVSKKIYYSITKGKGRVLSKAEAFGRLYCCGFEISEEYILNGEIYFVAKKIKDPAIDVKPSYGPLIKLKRVGKNGKPIRVYKLRTMHPFSEYLQHYVYQQNDLQSGGKFKNDFRISKEGKIFRKFWLDELPMIFNLLKGDIKLVGVRPLSEQYFNLYTRELQEKRTKTKPGLFPPFYADMPDTLEEIIASELKYLEAYNRAPFRTDIKYFWLTFKSIALKGARSK